jgi:hypothetical protein
LSDVEAHGPYFRCLLFGDLLAVFETSGWRSAPPAMFHEPQNAFHERAPSGVVSWDMLVKPLQSF